MERERTPQQAVELGIQMHLAGLSLSNTTSVLEELGVKRSRKAVHDWVHKADLQPDGGRNPDHIAIDETVIRINDKQFWLYAVVDPQSNPLLHVRFFHSTTTIATEMFLRELSEKHYMEDSLFLVDGAQYLQTAIRRAFLRFRYVKHGNRNSAEHVFREIKRRTQAFSDCFSNVSPKLSKNSCLLSLRGAMPTKHYLTEHPKSIIPQATTPNRCSAPARQHLTRHSQRK